MKKLLSTFTLCFIFLCAAFGQSIQSYSGIYPSLAYYNNEGECGTGAVVPWADRLWVITYAPHSPFKSSDKLYEITSDLKQIVRPESVGGTPANRMIHKESNQLFIGSYVISDKGQVRVIPLSIMQGRMTGNARHLTNPESKICYATMEEGFYEVDTKTLEVKTIFEDNNSKTKNSVRVNAKPQLLPGAHGKGLYSGQGVLVFSNNGDTCKKALTDFDAESGVLAEWNGKDWKVVRRNQFVEVTGPGSIYGNSKPETDPIWATGWDNKSILLGVRSPEKWNFYRLPKASHSYDGAHGWNTEWPRIRNIGSENNPEFLMTMHGMFWHFPATFTAQNSKGITPRSAYLKVIGDFTRWNNQLVFGCDDAAQKEFLNLRKIKGAISGPGQSNSNLWFTSLDKPDLLGPANASGAVWLNDMVHAGVSSDPFLFEGWNERCLWVKNSSNQPVNLKLEVDLNGNDQWTALKSIELLPEKDAMEIFSSVQKGVWIRLTSDKDAKISAEFLYTSQDKRETKSNPIFAGLSSVTQSKSVGGLLYSLGNNRRAMGLLAGSFQGSKFTESGYYELNEKMELLPRTDTLTAKFIRKTFAIPEKVVRLEESSALIVDDKGRRWRLPLGDKAYNQLTNNSALRICREVVTERDILNLLGTFYELPAENADGFAKIRPIASHSFRIHDFTSYRGMLVLTGINPDFSQKNEHIVRSKDGKAMVWCGAIDDLWSLGKPTGKGGPWCNSPVKAGVSSDPYLIGFYDKKSLQITHNSKIPVEFTIEVNPIGHGPWMTYKKVTVEPGKAYQHLFPEGFQGRWIRFTANQDSRVTTYLEYK